MSKLLKKIGFKKVQDLVNNIYWYHSINLGDGLITDGAYDIEKSLPFYNFDKAFIKGQEVLDVGCSDGFFSFHFEKLGAKSVLATDINFHDAKLQFSVSPVSAAKYEKKYKSLNLTLKESLDKNIVNKDILKILNVKTLNNFFIAQDLLNSKVKFQYLSIYELEKLNKKFDTVFIGSLIEHLKNPIEALEQARKITKKRCIIALSATHNLPNDNSFDRFRAKAGRFLIEKIGIDFGFFYSLNILNSQLVTYHGNEAGGSFFHFSKEAFYNAALASGFKKVKIYPSFLLYSHKKKLYSTHTVFHCFV